MESMTNNKESIKFLDNPIVSTEIRYPDSLTQEIREDYRKLNIPIENEAERSIQRAIEP